MIIKIGLIAFIMFTVNLPILKFLIDENFDIQSTVMLIIEAVLLLITLICLIAFIWMI